MNWTQETIHQRVRELISESLARPLDEVVGHASLVADLGAESIDFLDLQFRLETAFALTFGDGELWRGDLDLDDPRLVGVDGRVTAAGLERLRELQPHLRWERFPRGLGRDDLPMLVSPDAIARVLVRRLLAP